MPERAQETRGHYLLTSGKKGGAGDTLSPFIKVNIFYSEKMRSVIGVTEWVIKWEKPLILVGIGLGSSCQRVAF